MKEININIEGYNVNGICVACLNYNRTMFYHKNVKECFKILGNIDVPDGLTVQVCWECLARMKAALLLRAQMLRAYDCLIAYSREHTFLDSPNDLSRHATQRLSVLTCESVSAGVDDVKDELVEVDGIKTEEPEEKVEIDIPDTQPKNETEDTFDQFPDDAQPADTPASSDEDIQLSKLKDMKHEKRGRRKKKEEDKPSENKAKGGRRQRNLPEDIVQLLTMTEEEMWCVREADRRNADFLALKYRCSECIIAFQTRKQMEYHMGGKHVQKTEDKFQCDVCQGYFISKDSMMNHRELHMSAFRCVQCDLTTSMKRIMQAHLLTAHGVAKLHECGQCEKEFSTKSKLNYHKAQCRQERPQCDCCGKVFANKMTLRHHLRQSQGPQNPVPKQKMFIPCKGCDKVFFSRKSYRAHVVIHDGLTYPCPICGKLFQWKRNLSRHTRAHRERDAGARHSCVQCGKTFASRDCYNNHMRLSKRHVGESGYNHACQYCGKKFPTKWCLVDHVDWEHLKRIKYQCSVCFKAFKTAKIMVAHMNNIHEGKGKKEPDGEHLCEVCGKSYKTVKRLKGHVWAMHTNRAAAKSFKCALCPATFTWQTSIYKHMKMMHDNNKRKQPRPPAKKPDYPPTLPDRSYYQQPLLPLPLPPLPLTGVVHTM